MIVLDITFLPGGIWFAVKDPGSAFFGLGTELYGRRDFGRAICLAANCGDDTDCTAAIDMSQHKV